MIDGRRIDDRVRGRELVMAAIVGCGQSDAGVERRNVTGLGEGDDPVRLIPSKLPYEPLRDFELHDCGEEPVSGLRKRRGDDRAGW